MTVMVVMVVVAYLQELPAAGRRRVRSEFQASLMRAAGAAGSSLWAVVFRPARPPPARLAAAAGGALVTSPVAQFGYWRSRLFIRVQLS